jgi:hypothetical protein
MATGSFLLFTHQCGHCADHGNFSPYAMAKKHFFIQIETLPKLPLSNEKRNGIGIYNCCSFFFQGWGALSDSRLI